MRLEQFKASMRAVVNSIEDAGVWKKALIFFNIENNNTRLIEGYSTYFMVDEENSIVNVYDKYSNLLKFSISIEAIFLIELQIVDSNEYSPTKKTS